MESNGLKQRHTKLKQLLFLILTHVKNIMRSQEGCPESWTLPRKAINNWEHQSSWLAQQLKVMHINAYYGEGVVVDGAGGRD